MINQKFIEIQRLIKNFMKTHPYVQYYLSTEPATLVAGLRSNT